MAQLLKLIQENQKLKYQLNKFKQVSGILPFIEDSTLKGGYRVVYSIQERDAIDMCHRKIGMIVSVKISETEYKNYRLINKNNWVEVTSNNSGLEIFLYTITNLAVGQKTIIHNLNTLNYIATFRDTVTKERLYLTDKPYGLNALIVHNIIPFQNPIEVTILKL